MNNPVVVGGMKIGGSNPLILIAGPCVIENEKHCLSMAGKLSRISEAEGIGLIFKSSYDKANRMKLESFRGPGIKKGLSILKKVKREFNLPVITDVHRESEVDDVAEVADIIQIPAFLCRQTDLLVKAAGTKKPVNIKKGQFVAPWDMKYIVEKAESAGNKNIIVTERGYSFGYNNLVCDIRSLCLLNSIGTPVVLDVTHSLQLPGGRSGSSGGQSAFIAPLARAGVASGCDGIFMEVHNDPEKAPCDGPNMLNIKHLPDLIKKLKDIDRIVKG
ncbi:3-deoxy-8-phosphooctulonate synthase [bacterium]|jgi:2-dehydro-3-deoxyphosphooctonate aldolase (KDO 8-P synthase)|nr:3-deoxy-8-phosphooctulonate synthase [bacterium]